MYVIQLVVPTLLYFFIKPENISMVKKTLLEKNIDISHTNLNIEKGKSLPTLGIGASYSYDNFFDKNNLSGAVFVTLSVPISNLWEGGHNEKGSQFTVTKRSRDIARQQRTFNY